jgi:hypothetical protein
VDGGGGRGNKQPNLGVEGRKDMTEGKRWRGNDRRLKVRKGRPGCHSFWKWPLFQCSESFLRWEWGRSVRAEKEQGRRRIGRQGRQAGEGEGEGERERGGGGGNKARGGGGPTGESEGKTPPGTGPGHGTGTLHPI